MDYVLYANSCTNVWVWLRGIHFLIFFFYNKIMQSISSFKNVWNYGEKPLTQILKSLWKLLNNQTRNKKDYWSSKYGNKISSKVLPKFSHKYGSSNNFYYKAQNVLIYIFSHIRAWFGKKRYIICILELKHDMAMASIYHFNLLKIEICDVILSSYFSCYFARLRGGIVSKTEFLSFFLQCSLHEWNQKEWMKQFISLVVIIQWFLTQTFPQLLVKRKETTTVLLFCLAYNCQWGYLHECMN